MHKRDSNYRTFGTGRSVRLGREWYRNKSTLYFVTACCRDHRRDFEDSFVARTVLETWLEVCRHHSYRAWGMCVMPDHLHIMVQAWSEKYSLGDVVRDAKSLCLARLRKRAPLYWQAKYHDHVLRSYEDPNERLMYLLDNPVRERFVEAWEEWEWSYVDPDAFA